MSICLMSMRRNTPDYYIAALFDIKIISHIHFNHNFRFMNTIDITVQ